MKRSWFFKMRCCSLCVAISCYTADRPWRWIIQPLMMVQHAFNCQLVPGWIHQLQCFDSAELLPHGTLLNITYGLDMMVWSINCWFWGGKNHRMLLPNFQQCNGYQTS